MLCYGLWSDVELYHNEYYNPHEYIRVFHYLHNYTLIVGISPVPWLLVWWLWQWCISSWMWLCLSLSPMRKLRVQTLWHWWEGGGWGNCMLNLVPTYFTTCYIREVYRGIYYSPPIMRRWMLMYMNFCRPLATRSWDGLAWWSYPFLWRLLRLVLPCHLTDGSKVCTGVCVHACMRVCIHIWINTINFMNCICYTLCVYVCAHPLSLLE